MKNKNKSLKKIERVIQLSSPTDLWEVEDGTARVHSALSLFPPSREQRVSNHRSNSPEGPHRSHVALTRKHRTEDLPLVCWRPGVPVTRRHLADCREVAQGLGVVGAWRLLCAHWYWTPVSLDLRGHGDAQREQMAVTHCQGRASSMALSSRCPGALARMTLRFLP